MTQPAVDWPSLVEAARQAREHAYAPYSKYSVGAAVLTESGRVFTGCNVENASYGLALCAERSAIAAMITAGERQPRAIAIITDGPVAGPPCGMCRQVLVEFAADMDVHLASTRPGVPAITTTLSRLLPEPFSPRMLLTPDSSEPR